MDILQKYIDNAEGIVLKAENDKYLSVISYPDRAAIEASKDVKDNYCIFHITKIDDFTIALQSKSWNNKYLSRIWRNGDDNIEAAKDAIDEFCLFKVYVVDRKIIFKADNSKFFAINQVNWNNNIEAKSPPGNVAKFKIESARNMML